MILVSSTFAAVQAAQDEVDLVEEQLRGERLKAQAAQREVSNVVARLEAVRCSVSHAVLWVTIYDYYIALIINCFRFLCCNLSREEFLPFCF